MQQRLLITLFAFTLALGISNAIHAEETCLKRLFNHYCLGGDYATLLREGPSPLHQQQFGDRQAAIYFLGRERIYAMAFKGRIYKVLRKYQPATQLRYEELQGLLDEKYGAGQDNSKYPSYAASRGSRVVAIRRGDGRAEQRWSSGQGWHVELSWTREMGVAVSYVADELDAARRAEEERNL